MEYGALLLPHQADRGAGARGGRHARRAPAPDGAHQARGARALPHRQQGARRSGRPRGALRERARDAVGRLPAHRVVVARSTCSRTRRSCATRSRRCARRPISSRPPSGSGGCRSSGASSATASPRRRTSCRRAGCSSSTCTPWSSTTTRCSRRARRCRGTPSSVVLEITERAPIEKIRDVGNRVAQLRALGYRIAVDDLGAGYAGLTSFAHLEPEVVKVDMSLIRGLDRSPMKQKLLSSIVDALPRARHPDDRRGHRDRGRARHARQPRRRPLPGLPLRAPAAALGEHRLRRRRARPRLEPRPSSARRAPPARDMSPRERRARRRSTGSRRRTGCRACPRGTSARGFTGTATRSSWRSAGPSTRPRAGSSTSASSTTPGPSSTRCFDHRNLNDVPGLENSTCENIAIYVWRAVRKTVPQLVGRDDLGDVATAAARTEGPERRTTAE